MFADIDASLMDRWQRLGMRVRCALDPDEPRLLEQFLGEARYLASWEPVPAWPLFEKSYQLLLDTCRDVALPWHWRQQCLDHAYRPLNELQRLAVDASRRQRLCQLSRRLAEQELAPSLSYPEAQEGIEND
ncbi:MAG: hypothetical protein GAK45_00677 [Pseudomonas citronellolis]|nr:MAG: hypothetical protein GAK45_00677 [Pseudomonas citronellolis]